MDHRRLPYNFEPDPEMQRIKPLVSSPKIRSNFSHHHQQRKYQSSKFDGNEYPKTIRSRKRLNDEFFLVEKNNIRPFRRSRIPN